MVFNASLVEDGAIVVGPKPVGGLGVMYDDWKIESIADQVWGTDNSKSSAHHFGAGRVYATEDLATVLRSEGIVPDISVTNTEPDASVLTLHRHSAHNEIYFLSNQQNVAQDLKLSCRVHSIAPEIWHAEDGGVEPVSYESTANGITMTLHLNGYEAIFLMFHRSSLRARVIPEAKNTEIEILTGPMERCV